MRNDGDGDDVGEDARGAQWDVEQLDEVQGCGADDGGADDVRLLQQQDAVDEGTDEVGMAVDSGDEVDERERDASATTCKWDLQWKCGRGRRGSLAAREAGAKRRPQGECQEVGFYEVLRKEYAPWVDSGASLGIENHVTLGPRNRESSP